MPVRFSWNGRKETANRRRHGVSFEEAVTVFADPLARVHDDPEHSAEENREILVGHSDRGRLLLVCFSERTGAVRLISARRVTSHERKDYEEGIRRRS
jgi:uncharacterized DUF497 family protein